jgi:hypothetical protein
MGLFQYANVFKSKFQFKIFDLSYTFVITSWVGHNLESSYESASNSMSDFIITIKMWNKNYSNSNQNFWFNKSSLTWEWNIRSDKWITSTINSFSNILLVQIVFSLYVA